MELTDLWQPRAAKYLGEKARVLFNKENDLLETLNRHGIFFNASDSTVTIEFRELSKRIRLMDVAKREALFKKTKTGVERPPLRVETRKYPDLDSAIRGITHILEGYETELKDLREFIARIKNLRASLSAFKQTSLIPEGKRVEALNGINELIKEFGRKEDFRKQLAKEKLEKAAGLLEEGKISNVWLVLDGAVNRAASRITAINNTLKPKSLTRQALLENYKKEVEGEKKLLAGALLKHLRDSVSKAMDFQASVSKNANFVKKRVVEFYGKKLSKALEENTISKREKDYYFKEIVAPKLSEYAGELRARTKAKKLLEVAGLVENAGKLLKAGEWVKVRNVLRSAYVKLNEVEKYGPLTDEHHAQLLENHDHLIRVLSGRASEPNARQAVELVKKSRAALEQKNFGDSHCHLSKALETRL